MFSQPKSPPSSATSTSSASASAEVVPAIKYNIQVYESNSAFAIAHAVMINLQEFFVPSYKLCFNEQAAFQSNTRRRAATNNVEEVLLPKTLVEQISKIARLRAELKQAEDSLHTSSDFMNVFGIENSLSSPRLG